MLGYILPRAGEWLSPKTSREMLEYQFKNVLTRRYAHLLRISNKQRPVQKPGSPVTLSQNDVPIEWGEVPRGDTRDSVRNSSFGVEYLLPKKMRRLMWTWRRDSDNSTEGVSWFFLAIQTIDTHNKPMLHVPDKGTAA